MLNNLLPQTTQCLACPALVRAWSGARIPSPAPDGFQARRGAALGRSFGFGLGDGPGAGFPGLSGPAPTILKDHGRPMPPDGCRAAASPIAGRWLGYKHA